MKRKLLRRRREIKRYYDRREATKGKEVRETMLGRILFRVGSIRVSPRCEMRTDFSVKGT